MDFYNGPGSFARWPTDRREAFLDDQRARGDLWNVLFDAPLTGEALTTVAVPVHVIEGGRRRPPSITPSVMWCCGTYRRSSTPSSREPGT